MISLNVRGLGERVKRRAIFDYYRQRADIICLLETHSTADDETRWKMEWSGRILFSHGESNSRGVCILFKKDLFINVENIKCDSQGRYIVCEINSDPENCSNITLCCVYAPNKNASRYYTELRHCLTHYNEQKIIIGDLNVVMNPELDRYNSTYNDQDALEIIEIISEEWNLTDVWRDRNPDTKLFSWRSKNRASRIDNALVSHNLSKTIENVTYLQGIMTDHRAIYLSIQQSNNKRGPGYWKLNNLLLTKEETLQQIKEAVKQQIQRVENSKLNDMEKWISFKIKIAEKIKGIARSNGSTTRLLIAELSEKVDEYEQSFPLTELDMELYQKTKVDLDELCMERARGLIFRSKVRWYEGGEINSKYFYNLEKARSNSKSSNTLITDSGQHLTDNNDILAEEFKFYTDLYKEEPDTTFRLENTSNIRISQQTQELCQQPISEEDISNALKMMKNGKSPGADGLTVEFYKMFWVHIKSLLLKMITFVFESGSCDKDMCSGILNLIPKKGKDSRFLKNLRPITLLNVDYKIVEKIIGRRLDAALQEVIHCDQSGFMPGRDIACSIRRVFDILEYCKAEEIDAVLINLDFIKCFDKISSEAIMKSLQYFEVPGYIQKWVKILYSNFTIKVQNNGFFTQPIEVKKSVHQGGCMSVQLFLFCAEVIARELRQCHEDSAITVKDILYLLSQFADDMNIASLYGNDHVNGILSSLCRIKENTGFSINYDKTEIYRMWSLRNSNAEFITQGNIRWTSSAINVLGVMVAYDPDIIAENYDTTIAKMKVTLEQWKHRNLSLIGKVTIINTLAASLFVHKMRVLPSISEKQLKSCENYFSSFLWNNKRAKIPMKTLKQSYINGGLQLVCLRTKDCALKISWAKLLQKDPKLEHLVYQFLQPDLKQDIWMCNTSPKDVKCLFTRPSPFWSDVLKAWCSYNYSDLTSMACQFIWFNSLIRIGGSPVFWSQCYSRGLKFVYQLLQPNGSPITPAQAKQQFHLTLMQLNSLMSAIPAAWKTRPQEYCTNSKLQAILKDPCATKTIYANLISLRKSEDKRTVWEKDLSIEVSPSEFRNFFGAIKLVTNVPKYRSFQYRLLHRALVLNIHLFRWGIKCDNLCSLCSKEREDILHLFYNCPETTKFWLETVNFIKMYSTKSCKLSAKNVIFNCIVPEHGNIANFICLLGKHYIYKQRCSGGLLNFSKFRQLVWSIENTEKYIALKNNQLVKHCRKWSVNSEIIHEDNAGLNSYIQYYVEAQSLFT